MLRVPIKIMKKIINYTVSKSRPSSFLYSQMGYEVSWRIFILQWQNLNNFFIEETGKDLYYG